MNSNLNFKNNRKPFILIAFALFITFSIFLFSLQTGLENLIGIKSALLISHIVAGIITPVLIILILKISIKDLIYQKSFKFSLFIPVTVLAIFLNLFSDLLLAIIDYIYPIPVSFLEKLTEMYGKILTQKNILDIFYGILVVAIVPALSEEWFFRGIFLGLLRKKWEKNIAVSVTSALFAFLHSIPWFFIPLFLVGLVLGFLTVRTGSIWPAVWVHAISNFISILLFYNFSSSYISFIEVMSIQISPIVSTLISISIVVFFVLSLRWVWKVTREEL